MRSEQQLARAVALAIGLAVTASTFVFAEEGAEPPTLTELEARLDAARQALEGRTIADDTAGAASEESADTAVGAERPFVDGTVRAVPLDATGDDLDAPMVLVATPPRYPPAKLRRGIKGELMLRVLVEADGRISKVEVEKTSGHEDFDSSAIQSVSNWSFRPAQIGGKPQQA